jgi:hypothetical protein
MAPIPTFVSTGSSLRISTKPIDLSFSKRDGLIGNNFQRLALMSRRSNGGQLLLEGQGHERVVLAGHFVKSPGVSTNSSMLIAKCAATILFPMKQLAAPGE